MALSRAGFIPTRLSSCLTVCLLQTDHSHSLTTRGLHVWAGGLTCSSQWYSCFVLFLFFSLCYSLQRLYDWWFLSNQSVHPHSNGSVWNWTKCWLLIMHTYSNLYSLLCDEFTRRKNSDISSQRRHVVMFDCSLWLCHFIHKIFHKSWHSMLCHVLCILKPRNDFYE